MYPHSVIRSAIKCSGKIHVFVYLFRILKFRNERKTTQQMLEKK